MAAKISLHPLHVESVAWISERKDVLSTFLEMVALLLYIRFVESRTVSRYLAMTGVFGLSLMAKPMLVTFPFVLLLLDFWPLRRLNWPPSWATAKALFVEKLPLLTLSAIASVLTFVAQRNYGAVVAVESLPILTRFADAAAGYVAYMGQAFWPVNLGILYPRADPPAWLAAFATILLLAVTVVALRFAKLRPYVLTGWFWYLGMLVPVIGLVQVGVQARADRYTYVPFVGLSIAVVWAVGDWVARTPRLQRAAGVMSAFVLVVFAAIAYRQAGYWVNSRALFEHTIAVTGPNYIIRNNLGVVLLAEGDVPGAIEQYRDSVAINANYAEAHANLGHGLMRAGQLDPATDELRAALRLNPKIAPAQADLGTLLARAAITSKRRATLPKRCAPCRGMRSTRATYVLSCCVPESSIRLHRTARKLSH